MTGGAGEHTPGPWVATPMVKHANNAFYITATPDGNNSEKEVAVVGPCLAATTEANARLIAAAPELLEAAELILERGYVSESIEEERDDHLALRAAVAKARGQ